MKILEQHEQMEMLVLDEMRKLKILDHIIFGGGTMLRLCFELNRYSVDLDFYLKKDKKTFHPWAKKLSQMFTDLGAQITDEQEKHFSYLWEVKLASYPRKLKIEVRKQARESKETQLNIAHSTFSPLQVRLRTLTLQQMWKNKIQALLDRNEIRDAYDLDFLTRRQAGKFESLKKADLEKILKKLEGYKMQDYKVKLGSVLNEAERKFIISHEFAFLKAKVSALI